MQANKTMKVSSVMAITKEHESSRILVIAKIRDFFFQDGLRLGINKKDHLYFGHLTTPKISDLMFSNILQNTTSKEKCEKSSYFILSQLKSYLSDLSDRLDAQIDKRLVRTLFDLCTVIILFRNRVLGLVLSELGGYITGLDKAPAGTKRISNLLPCHIDSFLCLPSIRVVSTCCITRNSCEVR